MTLEIAFVLALLAGAVVLFATEKLPVDMVALMVMSALLVSGVVSPAEGIAGFSNPATVTVGAMFILSAGLSKTGALNFAGAGLVRLGRRSFWLALASMMLFVGSVSAFVNNTAAVAVFMPVMLTLARDIDVSPSKLLIPLSFASMFGGVCTLLGTSTNILVSSVAEQHGQPPFGMFEFAPLGLTFFGVGLVYMLTVGVRLIPGRRAGDDLAESFGMGEYLTDIVLLPESASVGRTIEESPLVRELNVAVLEVSRGGERVGVPPPDMTLEAGDVLRVRTDVRRIRELQSRVGVRLKPGIKWREEDLESESAALVEAVVALNSPLETKTLEETNFRAAFGGTVLAIRHRGQLLHENISTTPLVAGDTLLVEVRRERLDQLKQSQAFLIVSEVGLPEFRRRKLVPALLIILGVVVAAAAGFLPVVVAGIVGSLLLILTRCLTIDEAYRAVEWRIIFLLAGVLTLGVAMEKSGAARLMSDAMISGVGGWGPVAVVSGLFLLTTLLTNVMSNNATAALLTPIAIVTAESLALNPRPFLMAVTFAASLSFMTPVGYQTNTLIYGPGQYRFMDFVRVGTPLNLLFWLLGTLLIPLIWAF
ncbi:MAG TPA: SLC13 family permease [Pyrinomonadaceae bacterium]|nr:SLC13 family permease [Pyrinomonadaceae bacterium]